MKSLKVYLLISLISIVSAEDLGIINLNYQKSRIKAKAQNSSSQDGTCIKYVEIKNTREWNEKKDELNTYIENNSKCKKYIIYNEIRNVDTTGFNANASNSNGEYEINLGVIMQKNHPNIDIQVYTKVVNSKLRENGILEMKANVGSVIIENDGDDIDEDNLDITAVSSILNSEIGQLDIASEYGLNKAKEFLTKDNDDPFSK